MKAGITAFIYLVFLRKVYLPTLFLNAFSFRRYLIEPRSQNEDDQRREFILNLLLLGSVILTLVGFILALTNFLLFGSRYTGVPVGLLLIPLTIFLGLFLLSRLRFYLVSAYLFVVLYFLLATFTLYRWGTILPTGTLLYALVIVIAGILVSTRFALICTAAISCTLLTLNYLETSGLVQPQLYWVHQPVGDTVTVFIAVFGLIGLISWISNRDLEKSLLRARHSEAALTKERDLLEVKVEERTRELWQLQTEKVAQLYRFAEFGRLSSGVLHDLVGPLATVSMNLQLLDSSEESALVHRAIEGTKRIEQFLESARRQIQTQKELQTFSVSEQLGLCVRFLAYKGRKAKTEIEQRCPEDVQIYGSPVRFYQVITNLISNAIDAYEGQTTIGTRKVLVSVERQGNQIELAVRDWGCGIKAEDQEKIFEPLYTTKALDRGTGLGLSICRDIVQKDFLGNITLQSHEGRGTVFTISFPIG